ncbi:hypothetical protein [Nocardia farcinica]|uniref:hypothetical protein n=1 Tax=Nocardia farcinica TaxID=37329 RepID=UPI001E50A4AF|nr:hypothetical protein [Nocardia farcinica]
MTEPHIPGSPGRLRPRPPLDAVVRVDQSLPYGLGNQLRALYARCDGFLSPSGIAVYAVADTAERNATFEMARHAPGFALFGDDSGGRGFLADARSLDARVYADGLGDLDPADVGAVADDLSAWSARDACAGEDS